MSCIPQYMNFKSSEIRIFCTALLQGHITHLKLAEAGLMGPAEGADADEGLGIPEVATNFEEVCYLHMLCKGAVFFRFM